jgi:hypothetical protein
MERNIGVLKNIAGPGGWTREQAQLALAGEADRGDEPRNYQGSLFLARG